MSSNEFRQFGHVPFSFWIFGHCISQSKKITVWNVIFFDSRRVRRLHAVCPSQRHPADPIIPRPQPHAFVPKPDVHWRTGPGPASPLRFGCGTESLPSAPFPVARHGTQRVTRTPAHPPSTIPRARRGPFRLLPLSMYRFTPTEEWGTGPRIVSLARPLRMMQSTEGSSFSISNTRNFLVPFHPPPAVFSPELHLNVKIQKKKRRGMDSAQIPTIPPLLFPTPPPAFDF